MTRTEWAFRVTGGVLVSAASAITAPGGLVDAAGHTEWKNVVSIITVAGFVWVVMGWLFLPTLKERTRKLRMSDRTQWGLDIVYGLSDADVRAKLREVMDVTYADRIARVDTGVDIARRNAERMDGIEENVSRAAKAMEALPSLERAISELNTTFREVQTTIHDSKVVVARIEERVNTVRDAQDAHYQGLERRRRSRRASDAHDPEDDE